MIWISDIITRYHIITTHKWRGITYGYGSVDLMHKNSSDSGFLCEFRTTELTAKSFQKYLHSTFSQLPNIYLANLSTTYLLSQNLEELSSSTYWWRTFFENSNTKGYLSQIETQRWQMSYQTCQIWKCLFSKNSNDFTMSCLIDSVWNQINRTESGKIVCFFFLHGSKGWFPSWFPDPYWQSWNNNLHPLRAFWLRIKCQITCTDPTDNWCCNYVTNGQSG